MGILAARARTSAALLGCASLTLLASCLDFDRYGEAPPVGGGEPTSGGAPAAGAPATGGDGGDGGNSAGNGQGGEGGAPQPVVCGDGIVAASEECEDELGPAGACVDCVVVCEGDDEIKIAKHCYWLDGNGNESWANANGECDNWRTGAHLAAIESQGEQDALAPLFDDTVWLGGRDADMNGNWTWVTGELFTFENWDTQQGQPNQGGPNERCMGVYTGSTDNSSWHDIDCGFTEKYLCEWEPPKE